jgi:glycosyltransferase involved in cell wall biosynthesis
MPKVSVIIPTHNRIHFLTGAIESVLNQTFQDVEIIVIDDGSTDSTKEIVGTYIQRNPGKISYYYQPKKGVSVARNTGIGYSKGEFIAFLDSDDMWLPHKLEKQIRTISQESVGFAYSYAYVDEENRKTSKMKPFSPALDFNDLFLKEKSIITSTVLIRKEYLHEVGLFDESIGVAEDYDLWARILLKYKAYFIPEPLVIYRKHDKNISDDTEQMLVNGIAIFQKFQKNDTIPKKEVDKKLSYKHYQLGKLYYEENYCRKSAIQFAKAINKFPLIGLCFANPNDGLIKKCVLSIKPYLVLLYILMLTPFKNK